MIECSYCGKVLTTSDDKTYVPLRLADEEVGEERNICISCVIRAFDTVLGKGVKNE